MTKTPRLLFSLMRKTFAFTGGWSNDFVNSIISKKRPFRMPEVPVRGVLGQLDKENIQDIIETLDEQGYCVFDQRLSDETVAKLVTFAQDRECVLPGTNGKARVQAAPGWPRYDLQADDIIQNDEICKLITDDSIRAVAGAYLGAEPIFDLLAMWWSYPSTHHRSEAAQMFHFDMDRFKFLKFFFYLTDVDLQTGPHTYIESTHRSLPWRFRRDGRFTDEELTAYYGDDRVKRITGPKGTIMAVDTRGFHKGEPVVKGHRLLFQIEFANSLFGMYYPPLKTEKLNPTYRERFRANPETYLKIFADT